MGKDKKELRHFNIVEMEKEKIEIEFDDKIMPNLIASKLLENGIDAYMYEPHSLIKGTFLHAEGKSLNTKMKKSLKELDSEFDEFESVLKKALK